MNYVLLAVFIFAGPILTVGPVPLVDKLENCWVSPRDTDLATCDVVCGEENFLNSKGVSKLNYYGSEVDWRCLQKIARLTVSSFEFFLLIVGGKKNIFFNVR